MPAWEVDADFKALIATLLRTLPLRNTSVIDTGSLQTVIRATRGNTARIFELFGDLAVAAIRNGEERITAEAIGAWRGLRSMTGHLQDEPAVDAAATARPPARPFACRK